MILAVDMGNTNIVVGCIDDEKIHFTERISTNINSTELEYALLIKTVMDIHGVRSEDVKGSIISSVIPSLTHIVKNALRKILRSEPLVVGAGLKTGLNIKIDDPGTLGADLAVDSIAALNLYSTPNIVIDMGTATTMTALDKDGSYIGGIIFPGVNVSLESLVSKTSLLPGISYSTPKKVIGTNTIDAMKSGIIYGEASRIDGMIDRFEEELGQKASVVATGGLAAVIIPHCRHDITLDPDLLLKGLKIIYDKNR
ncbi:MAG: type III pantothenate kinase [Lachnospiraceae bacterium]|nr:type III pantothenate kinase [Lachnospiraceae bacterium]